MRQLSQSRRCGFTLPELLVAVSIAMLLTALALPVWRGWMAEQRVQSAGSRLLAGLTAARRSAIDGSLMVKVCARTVAGGCGVRREWSDGWLSQHEAQGGWRTLRDSGPIPAGVRVEANSSALQEGVTFEARGFPVQASGGFASGSWLICARGARQRTVTLAPSGRARLSIGATCA